jgi:hypothetical protein
MPPRDYGDCMVWYVPESIQCILLAAQVARVAQVVTCGSPDTVCQ